MLRRLPMTETLFEKDFSTNMPIGMISTFMAYGDVATSLKEALGARARADLFG